MIELRNVSKWFGDVVALSDVSFSVGDGITALLGPNGAGKSTALRVICGLTLPSQGTVHVLGKSPRDDLSLYRDVGLVPQQEAVITRYRAIEMVRMAAVLQGLEAADTAARAALDVVEMDPDDPRPLRTYSKGMRQRVKVAQALVHDPKVVVLDEPLNGLDPRQRGAMVSLFRRLGEEGRCVIVSSHVLEEVERFGSRVLVIAEGRLAAEGDFHDIRELLDDRPHQLMFRASDTRTLAAELIASGVVTGTRVDGDDTLIVEATDVKALRSSVAAAARKRKVRLFEMMPLDDDLESVFRYLVTRR